VGGPAASVITAGEVGKKACPRLGLTEARCCSVWKGGWCPRAVTWVRTGVVVRVYDDFYTGFATMVSIHGGTWPDLWKI